MPCAWYIDQSQEATARSQHPGGVHVLLLDGAARFVRDDVDPGLWQVMHSRETPAEVLEGLESELAGASAAQVELPAHLRVPLALGGPAAEETLANSLGMRFVALPAGTFTMGVPDVGNDEPAPPECPPHEVTISRAFWMGVHEVTQRQYQSVMGTNASQHSPDAAGAESKDDFPVENVTWHEAQEFCRRLGDLPEETAAHRQYRLPTEAEWEYASRSGKSEPYHWTLRREPGGTSGEAAGIEPPLPVTEVGSYAANEFGLFDMRGNVWEWCADWFDRSYYGRSPRIDPQGPAKGYLKVVRGSDWIFVGEVCRINYPIMSPWQKSP
ncbi:MAG: SUMF1/EgtB/PvdO family nonheme iron enzyme, partial [Pirellulales bacterium]